MLGGELGTRLVCRAARLTALSSVMRLASARVRDALDLARSYTATKGQS
jgi:hypothetical protein